MPPKKATLVAAAAASNSADLSETKPITSPTGPAYDNHDVSQPGDAADSSLAEPSTAVINRALANSLFPDGEASTGSGTRAGSIPSVQSRGGSVRSDGSVPPLGEVGGPAVPKLKFRPNKPLARRVV